MIKRILSTGLIVLGLISYTHAKGGGKFGLGIMVGEPTGISGKFWLSGRSAIDGAVAWSFTDNEAFHLHGDYILHNFSLIKVERGSLPFYFGIGGRIKFQDAPRDDIFGVRIPLGLAYLFETAPLDVFIELVPMLDLAPDTDFDIAGSLGVRYFF